MIDQVLIVDDHEDFADNLREILENKGAHVHVANDPRAAIELAPTLDPALVLLDIRMPNMDGVTLHGALRDIHPRARYVLMTAYEGGHG